MLVLFAVLGEGEGGGLSYFAGGLFSDVILRWCTVKNIHDTCNCRLES